MKADLLVIGGGPAGATAAALLAGERRVVVVERSRGPHQKVCGEFLSGEAIALLRRLDLDLERRLAAVPIGRMRLTCGRVEARADLPFPAFGVTRDVLDEALLTIATSRGAEIRRGIAVQGLTSDRDGVFRARTPGDAIEAGTVLLATGKHDLRGHRRPAGGMDDLIGFKMHWRLDPHQRHALDACVEVHLFPGGYAGLQPVADDRANLCLLIAQTDYARIGRNWPHLLGHLRRTAPLLAERLSGATACWSRPLSIAGLPYGFVHRGEETGALHRAGDQLAVIPSFCGDGMAIALLSAERAADRIRAGLPPADGGALAAQIRLAHKAARLIRHPHAGRLAAWTASIAPGLLRWLAMRTRVAETSPVR